MRSIHPVALILTLIFGVAAQTDRPRRGAVASPEMARFQRLAAADGLPVSGVSALHQDSRGFLWVGSFIGLSRFDGYRFINYPYDQANPRSVSAASISSIIEMKSGKIWIGTPLGLSEYDESTDDFKRHTFDPANTSGLPDSYIKTLYEDRSGVLWIGTNTGGLSRFDAATQSFTNFRLPTVESNMIVGLAEDDRGNFWVGTNGGLYRFNRQTGLAERKSVTRQPSPYDQLSAMALDRDGTLWLGSRTGLCNFDPASGASKIFSANAGNQKGLSNPWIRNIYQTRSGVTWIGTNDGLSRYIPETDDFVSYRNDPANPNSLIEGEILAVLEDANEQLWVGGTSGLNKLNQKTTRFLTFQHDPKNSNSLSANEILSIYEDSQGIAWIGTRTRGQHGLLNRYDRTNKRFEVAAEFGDVLVFSILEDREGTMWIGAYNALYSLARGSKIPKKYQPLTSGTGEVRGPGLTVIAITEDSLGNILVATVGEGMFILDKAAGGLVPYDLKVVSRSRPSNNRVYSIVEDRRRQLWVATAEGLERIDADRQSRTVYRHDPAEAASISANDPGTIYEDSSGTIWIGTLSGGLNRFDPGTNSFKRFDRDDGLPSNDVFGIMEDDAGNLWLSTDRGMARFNIASESVRTYNVSDGVPNNPFDNKTGFKNRKGEMYFGGQNGFVIFDPREFVDSTYEAPVYLSEIRILEQSLKTKTNLLLLRELELSWQDYVVSFDFAALDLTDPKKIEYQWKLDGFDPEWINGGTRRTATYSNLPGGEYVLKVRATNVDGVWGDEMLNLIVRVKPPFYWTYWFWVLVAILIGVVILLLFRYRIGQLRAVSEAQTRFTQQLITSQEAERKRIAAELHDGLGQTLVIIKNRATLGLSKGDDRERVTKELGSISESASQALEEVREITNNLRPQLLDRLGPTKAIAAMLKKYSGVIEIKSDIDAIDGLFDEDQEISIYRIIQESVNNVIKHSNASNAGVKVKRQEDRILIEIEDNGKGFDPQSLPSEKRSFGLTGLRERAQLLGGELAVDSQIGIGTKVKVTFPTGTPKPSPASGPFRDADESGKNSS